MNEHENNRSGWFHSLSGTSNDIMKPPLRVKWPQNNAPSRNGKRMKT